MISKIAIIGLGSLGSFFADNISKLPGLELLVLVDYDIVEQRNVKNSIYLQKDIGRKKIDALEEMLKPITNANIFKIDVEFKEGEITLPKCDYVFDCRDSICKRGKTIDARLYISHRSLIIDCKKGFKLFKEKRGRYIEYMTKADIMYAASQAFQLVSNGIMYDLVKHQSIHRIDLDLPTRSAEKCILASETKPDMVYDLVPGEEKLINLPEYVTQICKIRQTQDIQVYIGTKKISHSAQVLPQVKELVDRSYASQENLILTTIQDISNIVNTTSAPFGSYVIKFVNDDDNPYIELLPDTGGA